MGCLSQLLHHWQIGIFNNYIQGRLGIAKSVNLNIHFSSRRKDNEFVSHTGKFCRWGLVGWLHPALNRCGIAIENELLIFPTGVGAKITQAKTRKPSSGRPTALAFGNIIMERDRGVGTLVYRFGKKGNSKRKQIDLYDMWLNYRKCANERKVAFYGVYTALV